MTNWVRPNKKGFVADMKERFKYDTSVYVGQKGSCDEKDEVMQLFQHQQMVGNFLSPTTPYRGLLLYHGLGVGKTCAAISAAAKFAPEYRLVVLLPASLKSNFVHEIKKCGGPAFNARGFMWRFVPVSNKNNDIKQAAIVAGLEERFIRANKGYYTTGNEDGGAISYKSLSSSARLALDQQMQSSARVAYEFFHYNGLNTAMTNRIVHMLENEKCVVVIDEVHNFISRACNNPSSLSARVHKTLCINTHNKVIAMSGTPFINHPREVAFLLNLVKGMDKVCSMDIAIVDPSMKPTQLQVMAKANKVAGVSYVDKIDFRARRLVLRLNDDVKQEDVYTITERIASALLPLGVSVDTRGVRTKSALIVPQDEEQFFSTFIDEQTLTLKNKDTFMRRMLGFASFFNYQDMSLFPRIKRNELIECTMSMHQYKRYRDARLEEIGKEEQAARRAALNMLDSPGSTYKTFSRMACNFAFPEKIRRPFPSTMRDEKALMDESVSEVHGTKDAYAKALQQTLDKVVAGAEKYLNQELSNHSCKFDAAIERIQTSPGSVLVYSNFRTLEGLGLFGETLKAHGFAEMRFLNTGEVEVDGKDDAPCFVRYSGDQAMLDAFNNKDNMYGKVIKVFMITQSGAEGITLRNVRQVHIMEPYWNNIRIDQVIGRAVRTCSHAELPPSERDVEVFRYVAKIDPQMVKADVKIMQVDNGKSADELVGDIALRKTKIMNEILGMIRDTSFDCQAHAPLHKDQVKCLTFDGEDPEDPVYNLDIELDMFKHQIASAVPENKGQAKAVRVEINGTTYLYMKDTKDLYDYIMFKRGVLRHRGRLIETIRQGRKGYIITND